MIITIDGPAASGKSSVAKSLAKKLNIYFLQTGLLYRALAHILITSNNDEQLAAPDQLTIERIASLVSYDYVNGTAMITYDGTDITEHLHSKTLDQAASTISAHQVVRDALLQLQRDVATRYDIVAEGRDCGSVVFPNADYKFFLTASLATRAQRYLADPKRAGKHLTPEKAQLELEARDLRDTQREVAPLVIPRDATIIDNSDMSFDETIDQFLKIIKGLKAQ